MAVWKVDGTRTAGGRETSCRELGSAFDSLFHLGVWIRSQEVSFGLIKDWKSFKSRTETSSSHRLREGIFDSGYFVLRKRDQGFFNQTVTFFFFFSSQDPKVITFIVMLSFDSNLVFSMLLILNSFVVQI